jgi:hypothetical protein
MASEIGLAGLFIYKYANFISRTSCLYMKRPASPMITVEIQDISRLAKFICIPSMVERATPKDTTLQKILYFGLPN